MTNVRSSINQQVQIAVEVTRGTLPGGGASKLLDAFTWTFGLKPTTKQFRGTGRQYPSASALLTEMSAGKVSGPGDFAQVVYLLSGLFGSGSPTLHSPSTTAYDWTWTPGLTGSYAANAKTFGVQQGDAIDAEQYLFLVFTGFGYSFDRKQELQIASDWFSQTFTDGITLTASPTVVEQLPMVGAQFNLYLDSTSGGIGGTQLVDPLKVDFKASGYYDPYWPINRSAASFTNIIDKEKKNELSITLQANSTAIAMKGSYLENGARAYVRVDGVGPTIDGANSVTAAFRHDMACFVTDMAEFSDVDGVYAVQYKLTVGEDSAWSSGTAQKFTATNLLSAL